MDILDILIAKKKSFTGETEKLTRQANEAMAKANEVAAKIDDAEEALSAAQNAQEAAEAVNIRAQEIANNLESMKEEVTTAANAVVDEKIAEMAVTEVTVEDENTSSYKSKKTKVRKKGILNSFNIMKNYTATGFNEDGSMTQKAITNALNSQKTELENKIKNIKPSGGNNSGNISGDIVDADPGSIIIVGDNGNIAAGSTTESDLIRTEIAVGTYKAKNAVGIEIDYENKTIIRVQDSSSFTAGADFDKYPMFGGRRRCIVDNSGIILAFENDSNYIEDGSLGQVMVYQPKFYYLKMPLKTEKVGTRMEIRKELIILSSIAQSGFNIHPLFIDETGKEVDYVLLSAYEGCAYNPDTNSYNLNDAQNVDFNTHYLSSISGAKPISGASQKFTVAAAEKMARNRGNNWYLTDLTTESANQLLMIVEYGSLNIQNSLNKGIVNLDDYNLANASCITGATSSLGSQSGMATATTQTHGTTTEIFSIEGKSAINYRGFENPYGNIWRFVGGVKIIGDGTLNNSYLNYKNRQGENHIFSSAIPSESSWISYFGYDPAMEWALIPTNCSGANSILPVGDYMYVQQRLDGENCCVIGGKQSSKESAGPFYYATDYGINTSAHSYSGRIMNIPTAGTSIYLENINKWRTAVGGE